MINKNVACFTVLTAIVGVGTMPSIAQENAFAADYCDATISAKDGYANLRSAPSVNAKIIRTIRTGKKVQIVAENEQSGKRWYRTVGGLYLRANQSSNPDCRNY
jgi:uncharacterized protein YgiM (DUF1202 family)